MDDNNIKNNNSNNNQYAARALLIESYHDHRHDHASKNGNDDDHVDDDDDNDELLPVEVEEDVEIMVDAMMFVPSTASSSSSSLFLSSIHHYFVRLITVLSLRYFLFLLITQIFICGVYASLIGSSFLPIFQSLGVDAATEQLLVLVCTVPYTAAPLIGVISDIIPLGGYHKKYWMVVAILLGSMGSAILTTTDTNTVVVVSCLVVMNLELAVVNLLNEGKYSELIRAHPEVAADIITFQQGCSAMGSLVAMCFVGPLTDSGRIKILFQIAFMVGLMPLIPLLFNWLPEEKRKFYTTANTTATATTSDTTNSSSSNSDSNTVQLLKNGCSCMAFDVDRLVQQRSTVGIALLVGIVGPILAVVSAYLSRTVGIAAVALVLLLVLVVSYRILPRIVANLVCYTILTRASSPSIRSALQYFYTASPDCLPDGPHFSYTYYLTYNGIIGEIFMLTAIVVYQAYLSRWSYQSVLFFTLFLSCSGRLVDVAMVLRWNITTFGIPDSVFFLLGSSMLESMTSMLHLMPFGAIVGKLCPPGTETATFAFIAGVSSFSTTFGSLVGSAMMDLVGLQTTLHTTTTKGENDDGSSAEQPQQQCDFTSLPLLIIGLAIVLPIAVGVPAIKTFIPDALQSEKLVTEDDWQEINQQEEDVEEHEECEDNGRRPSEQQQDNVEIRSTTNTDHQFC